MILDTTITNIAAAQTTFLDLGLAENLQKAVADVGYNHPTPIQAQAIPAVMAGADLIASANTGTGKTAAFVLPALHRLSVQPRNSASWGPRVLVLTPTRELATQVTDAVRAYSKFSRVQMGTILGGMPYRAQLEMLRRRTDFIVGTPGRLIDHLERGRLDLSAVEMLILDEADRMLDMGFLDPVEQIAAACPAERQTLLFTATVDARMTKLAGRLLRNPQRIDVAGRNISVTAIDQKFLRADSLDHKEKLLDNLISQPDVGKAIVFAATKRDADRLAAGLSAKGFPAAPLHGDMRQQERNHTLHRLRQGGVRFLVATDVAARGIDIADISHVINFDLPRQAEDYVHRIGRTGRAGASGTAYSLFTRTEIGTLKAIERYTGLAPVMHVVPGLEPRQEQNNRSQPAGRPARRFGPKPTAAGQPARPAFAKSGFKSADRHSEHRQSEHRHSDRPSDRSADRSADRSFDKHPARPAAAARPAAKPHHHHSGHSAGQAHSAKQGGTGAVRRRA